MKKTQGEMILTYLDHYKTITSYEAMKELGCHRLAARISELKRDGHPIDKKMISVKNRFGDDIKIAEYSMM